ncbi:CLUMA_CG008065, isoform A [Clunio marinus]|uniref:CLUMA_CG008065, isoform A n=1 Tax=Clunio marinus TaxID=568069 RepID=A0A1J1I4P0_9DIPT|nr:CLUMA_CG008065, isoform A [Clunio marinus]
MPVSSVFAYMVRVTSAEMIKKTFLLVRLLKIVVILIISKSRKALSKILLRFYATGFKRTSYKSQGIFIPTTCNLSLQVLIDLTFSIKINAVLITIVIYA